MVEVRQTDEFEAWLDELSDQRAARRISMRILRAQSGLLGDVRPVGDGLSEMRIDYGPGYRVYFVQQGLVMIILLCGGDKSTQQRDIDRAKALARAL